MKRLAILFFYDKRGDVDGSFTYYANELKKSVSKLYIIANEPLTPEGREKLMEITDYVKVRENKGFDVWAYKEAMEDLSGEMNEYDEVILTNSTMFGPLYSLDEMFAKMDAKTLDFWGLTVFHKVNFDPFGTCFYGYITLHLQSHFIVVRKSLFSSPEFKNYWDTMPQINSYQDSVGKHETKFTKWFEDKGFKWEAYIDTKDLDEGGIYINPIINSALELVKNRRCPFVKKRMFWHNLTDTISHHTNGEVARQTFDFIKENTNYDVNLIWENLLRLNNMYDIWCNLHLNYILPTGYKKPNLQPKPKVALIMHLYYKDLFKECFEYAKSMPEYADIYLTVVDEEGKKLAENIFQNLKCNKLEVLLIENRGRDVSSLLVAGKNFYDKYDYICFTHDKKTSQVKPHSQGKSFAYKCFENSLATKDFVENVITTFEENPKLGILSPTPPNNGVFYGTFGTAWFENFENTVTLAKELNLKVDLDVNKRPMAPLGTMFWFRVISMKKLFDRNWNYKDFPKEPMGKNDGTILNAIERLYPFVCQDAGYYAGYLFTDRFASNEITNLHYTMDEIGKRIRVWNIYELLITISNLQNHDYNQILKTKILLRAIKTYLKYKIRKIFKKK